MKRPMDTEARAHLRGTSVAKPRHAAQSHKATASARRRARMLHVLLLVCGAHLALPAGAVEGKFDPRDPLGHAKKRHDTQATIPPLSALSIEVAPGDWGEASPDSIQLVLDAVGRELLTHVGAPSSGEIAIRVVPRSGSPKVLYDRGRNGEFVVHLTVRDDRWYQYAYQFAHELCHILTNFDHKTRQGERVPEHNQWFEEALCETASLFTLKQLAAKWAIAPPSRNWVGYDRVMAGYARRLIDEPHRHLAAGDSLKTWFGIHQASLRDSPYLRDKNELVATTLLPLFEAHPEYWRAIAYLNPKPGSAAKPFADYLMDWLAAAPDKQLPQEILGAFGIAEAQLAADAPADGPAEVDASTADASTAPPPGSGTGPAGPAGARLVGAPSGPIGAGRQQSSAVTP